MSKFMLSDDDAINDVNPFVTHDFSLPGSVKQMSNFDDFQEVPPSVGLPVKEKSVYCDYGLCAEEDEPCHINKSVQPHRNIDYGFTRDKKPKIGVSNKSIPWCMILLFLLIIVLALLYVKL